ncbi:S8 family serine peptidase [Salana multivorans]
MTATTASAEPADESPADPVAGAEASGLEKNQVKDAQGIVTVFVELDLPTTRDVAGSVGPQARGLSNAASAIEKAADDVVHSVSDATELYTAVNSVAGVAVAVDSAELDALAARDDVVSIKPIVPKERTSNAGSNAFTGATDAWESAGATGEGQTIAIIDTGVDFGHASFNEDNTWGAYPATYAGNQAYFTDEVSWPQGKVIGGYDFVGRDYTGGYTASPAAPDANPMDEADQICQDIPASIPRGSGHGTHVAGTAAGWGVNQDGSTYTGGYEGVDESVFAGLKVGPGSAPDADIVALKIFGCAGSTAYAGAALDWLADPANEIAQSVTVVNMSIGSTFATVDDPENAMIDALVDAGKIVVVSSGNSGDTTDVGGSPGNSSSSLTVANSVGNTFELEGALVHTGSTDGEGTVYAGQYSIAYTFPDGVPVGPQEIVTLTPGDLAYNSGCTAYSAQDAARVAGKTVAVAWNDNAPLPCGSAARAGNAAAAGADGIVFTGLNPVFSAGLSGDARIPTFQFTGPGTAELFDYEPSTGVISLQNPATWITYDNTLGVTVTADGVADTLNDSSSRGVHGSYGISKPDVAAPGTTISSVAVGTADGPSVKSGTSMAAPHAAGIAAITAEAHPDFTPVQVKAAVMNTASHDVRIGEAIFGPQRVGSGRVDAAGAVATDVIAYDTENPDGVSVTFGVLEVSEATTLTRSVTIENHGDASATLGASYTPQTEVPGVAYSVSPASVTVAAGGSATVDVTLTISDPAALARTLDPSMSADQGLGLAREYLSVAQGWLELSGAPGDVGDLRVPVSAAPKPVAALAANDVVFLTSALPTSKLKLTGVGLDQDGYLSIVAPFQLAATSEEIPGHTGGLKAADLKAVGTAPYDYDDQAEGGIAFGVSTWGPWATLGGSNKIEIVVENGTPGSPYTITAQKFNDGIDPYDTTIVGVWDKDGVNTGLELLNDLDGTIDSNTYDSAAAVLPVELAALGYPAGTQASDVSFTYSVYGTSWLAQETDGDVDAIVDVEFDGSTNLQFGDNAGPLFVGAPGESIKVTRSGPEIADPNDPAIALIVAATAGLPPSRLSFKPTGVEILLLSLHNKVGEQDVVVPIVEPGIPTPTPKPPTPPGWPGIPGFPGIPGWPGWPPIWPGNG